MPILVQIADKFEFPYKVYGIEERFINIVKTAYKKTTGNLGILLNGVQGTGKTVTCKILCNELKLPVITVTHDHPALVDFIMSITQDHIVFMDEYDKAFAVTNDNGRVENSSKVLHLMDSVYNNKYRKLFMLTTNDRYVHSRLLERPSRIRYIQEFRNLKRSVVEQIIDDILVDKGYKNDLVKFFDTIATVTVDIVKSIIEDVNIHNVSPFEIKDILNIRELNTYAEVTVTITDTKNKKKKPTKVKQIQNVSQLSYDEDDLKSSIYFCGYHSTITEILAPNVIKGTQITQPNIEYTYEIKKLS